MPGVVFIVASAPWGPVRIEHAASSSDMLTRVTAPPAHVEDCGPLEAGQVAAATRGLLPTPDPAGWIAVRVETARKAAQDARRGVSARGMTCEPEKAARAVQASHGGVVTGASAPASCRRSFSADVNVRAIRAALKMTQATFAEAFGFPIGTVQGWEQGQIEPDGPARVLLRVIERRPDVVREALAGA
jgi:putative transcriptional regulator